MTVRQHFQLAGQSAGLDRAGAAIAVLHFDILALPRALRDAILIDQASRR